MSGILEYFKSFIWAPTETGEVLPQPSDTPDILFNVILPCLPPEIVISDPTPIETYEEIITVNYEPPKQLSTISSVIMPGKFRV